ncbi:MAG: hypothetical protein LBL00_09310 [Endomicrobium sp.]|jgi:hypothetical protein|nr:hypothetical protein [Endomicrobium sp.]
MTIDNERAIIKNSVRIFRRLTAIGKLNGTEYFKFIDKNQKYSHWIQLRVVTEEAIHKYISSLDKELDAELLEALMKNNIVEHISDEKVEKIAKEILAANIKAFEELAK